MRSVALACLLILVGAHTASADDRAFARAFIGRQLRAIRAGDVHELQVTCEPRLHARLTPAQLARARKRFATTKVDDLVGSVERDKRGNLVIARPDGTPLVMLVEGDGLWRAWTAWFLAAPPA
ncbi:MAG TPA: hypothetical protein VFQ53_23585 [Kofleriaceae bacterium]|nr:hypothetical protein [Kofleriaceae bacterium]